MATPSNLYEYYSSQGKSLPSVSERANTVAKDAGITGYTGSASQNQQLLGYLTGLPSQGAITPASLEQAKPIQLPQQIPTTTNQDINNAVTGIAEATKPLTKQQQYEQGTQQLATDIANAGNQGSTEEAIYQELGVDTRKATVDRLQSQIEQEQKQTMDAINELRKNPEGLSAGALQARINDIQTESSNRLANYGITLSAASRDYTTAASIAERKVQQNTDRIKAQIESRKFILEQLGTELATEKAQQFQLQLRDIDTENDLLKSAITSAQKLASDGVIDGDRAFDAIQKLTSGEMSISEFYSSIGDTSTNATAGYNIRSYASDPQYEQKVMSIYNGSSMQNVTDAESADEYIKSRNKNSKITGDMVYSVASQYNIDPKMLLSMIQQESSFGTSNVALQNNNLTGITWSSTLQGNNPGIKIEKGSARPSNEGGIYARFEKPEDSLKITANFLKRNKLPNKYQGEFADIISTAVNSTNGSAENKKSVTQAIQNSIAKRDYSQAYTQLQNEVAKSASLDAKAKSEFSAKRTGLPALDSLMERLQSYEAAGGKMGLVKGKYEDIVSRLGQVSDPKYKAEAVNLKIALQAYRNDMSGAAFSEQEAKDYASVNPSGNNTLALNYAILDGMRINFQNSVNSITDTVAGASAKYLREYAQYQGLNPEQATIRFANDNPQLKQPILQLLELGEPYENIIKNFSIPYTQ